MMLSAFPVPSADIPESISEILCHGVARRMVVGTYGTAEPRWL